ncbi:hypothetical protein BJX66DRAFT_95883 [Aspergillus keveii]|uniref:Uncharacterized protein n=1 Tax=Aspergillus keveii TaxID=714993 RepID=A0ABR4FLM5_9EURO
MPRKAAAAARRGSGSMAWAAAAEELVALKGTFTFRASVLGRSEAFEPRRTRSNALIRVDGPRRSPRIGSASGVTSLESRGTMKSVLNANMRKWRRTDGGGEYNNSQALVLAVQGLEEACRGQITHQNGTYGALPRPQRRTNESITSDYSV